MNGEGMAAALLGLGALYLLLNRPTAAALAGGGGGSPIQVLRIPESQQTPIGILPGTGTGPDINIAVTPMITIEKAAPAVAAVQDAMDKGKKRLQGGDNGTDADTSIKDAIDNGKDKVLKVFEDWSDPSTFAPGFNPANGAIRRLLESDVGTTVQNVTNKGQEIVQNTKNKVTQVLDEWEMGDISYNPANGAIRQLLEQANATEVLQTARDTLKEAADNINPLHRLERAVGGFFFEPGTGVFNPPLPFGPLRDLYNHFTGR